MLNCSHPVAEKVDPPFGRSPKDMDSTDASTVDAQYRTAQVKRYPSGANIFRRLQGGNYYKLFSKPKGYVLLLNNCLFDKSLIGPVLENRDGTKQDQNRLLKVLTHIGFQVT